jgi:hypothetical protein
LRKRILLRRIILSGIAPQGESVRKAVKWISEECKENSDAVISILIQQAAAKFNLSPKDEEFLMAFYSKGCDR